MTKFKFVMTMALCLLAGAADAAVAVGSCEKKPATMRIGGSASISLVNEYDPESREYYDMGVYYIQVPPEVLDPHMTVLAVELDGPATLYEGSGQVISFNE